MRENLDVVKGAIDAGAPGVVLGRSVAQAKNPSEMLLALSAFVHEGADVDYVIKHFEL